MLHPTVWVVVRRPAWRRMAGWATLRRQQGFDVQVLDPADAGRLQQAPPSHVLLVGHPRAAGAYLLPTAEHPPPCRHMATAFHGDHAVVHGSLAEPPRHAVGRLPVHDDAELERVLARYLRPLPAEPAVVRFVDGDPRWGSAINRACHLLAGRAARRAWPAGLASTRASFNPVAPAALRADVVAWIAQGARLLVYVGHGQPDHVDGIHAHALPVDGGSVGVVVLACCHAGGFAADAPSLAERWLLTPGGPRAILAASNVSDPRLNPALADAFVRAALLPGATVGDAVLAARRALDGAAEDPIYAALRLCAPPRLRRAHRGLYNLLGDPTAPVGLVVADAALASGTTGAKAAAP
ncbi:MAG: hypothetical protein HY904_13525 [Deltaproteobacteria bacterium]|nr:hypothetical protein [Deltaproteobacteria bacterium]